MTNEEIKVSNIDRALDTAVKLFVKDGIYNTTREKIARESGLSRKSTERYFPTMNDCVVQASVWVGQKIREQFKGLRTELLESGEYTAKEVLITVFAELRQIVDIEPRLFAFYAEYKAYLYRNSPDRAGDYRKFMESIRFRHLLQSIFELGQKDGTVTCHQDPETNARYLTNTIMAYFSNAVLLYDTQPELLKQTVEKYISDTIDMYCK